jgi:hypothetical protein
VDNYVGNGFVKVSLFPVRVLSGFNTLVDVSNSLIVDQTSTVHNQVHHIAFSYSDYVPQLVPGVGNISSNPLFATDNQDPVAPYYLFPDSPCIDAGTKTNLTTDILGNPRPVDFPGIGHEGEFSYDMGCYELQLPTPTPTESPTPVPTATMNPNSDINENGKVSVEDLMILLNDWKKVSGP